MPRVVTTGAAQLGGPNSIPNQTAVFQRQDSVGAIEDAMVVCDHHRSRAARLPQLLQQLNHLGGRFPVKRGGGFVGQRSASAPYLYLELLFPWIHAPGYNKEQTVF